MPEGYADTTGEHYRQYRASVLYWVDYFRLAGWSISVERARIDGDWSQLAYDIPNRSAVFSWTRSYPMDYSCELDPIKFGFHEVCELMLARLGSLARSREATIRAIDEEIHNIIRCLENSVLRYAEADYGPYLNVEETTDGRRS